MAKIALYFRKKSAFFKALGYKIFSGRLGFYRSLVLEMNSSGFLISSVISVLIVINL